MVAYSFNTAFVPLIEAGIKRQTIRLPRRRHARPGERIQLYQGMRTRDCRKLIPDPLCVGVDEVRIDLRPVGQAGGGSMREALERVMLEVNGIPLHGEAADAYARGDGFPGLERLGFGPRHHMLAWWAGTHGCVLFTGVAIRWEPEEEPRPCP
jgi:hypothetical protein